MRRPTSLVVALLIAAQPAAAQRQRLSLDPNWRFMRGDTSGAQAVAFDDRRWRTVDLPHDWSIEGPFAETNPGAGRVGYLPTGVGWYRKTFTIPSSAQSQTWLELDGVYMNSDVWINGVLLGRRPNGYASQWYDLTPHLARERNVIAVRVDNAAQPNSRYYTGSGISRHTWLTIADPLHLGHWGTFVMTPAADTNSADVIIQTRVENDHSAPRLGVLRSVVVDSGGVEVARAETTFSLAAREKRQFEQRVNVLRPRLWSPGSPAMYALRQNLLVGGRSVDDGATPFGIRTIAFDKDRGFLLSVCVRSAHVDAVI